MPTIRWQFCLATLIAFSLVERIFAADLFPAELTRFEPIAANPVFDELFDGYPLLFERDSPESLADRLR